MREFFTVARFALQRMGYNGIIELPKRCSKERSLALPVPVKSMFCRKCGKELTEDGNFCLYCGCPVTREEKTPVQEEQPKKKRGKGKFWLIGAASVLFVLGMLVAIFYADIAAWAERLILPPETLMKKALASVAEDVGIGSLASGNSLETPRRYKIGLYMDQSLQELYFDTAEDGAWISDLNLQIVSGKEDDLQKTQMSLFVKDQSVISLDVIQNAQKAWVGFPELSKQYLEFTQEDLYPSDTNSPNEELLTSTEMTEIFRTYGSILLDSIHRATKKNVTLELEGVSQDVLQLKAVIQPEDARRTLLQMAKQLKEDAVVRRLMNQGYASDVHEEMVAALEEYAEAADWRFQLVAYLDNRNKLTGLEVADEDGETLFFWARTVSESEFATLLTCGELVLSAKGLYSDGKQTGQCQLTFEGETIVNCSLEAFCVNKNGFNGSLIFSVPSKVMRMLVPEYPNEELKLKLSQDRVSGGDVYSLMLMLGNVDYLGLRFTEEKAKDFSVQVPAVSISANKEGAIARWQQSLDWSKMLQNLKDAGVPFDPSSILPE